MLEMDFIHELIISCSSGDTNLVKWWGYLSDNDSAFMYYRSIQNISQNFLGQEIRFFASISPFVL